MPRKAILNVTSRKKRNGMLSFSNSNNAGSINAIAQNALTILGSNTGANNGVQGFVHFRPTGMDLFTGTTPNPIDYAASRTSQTCFMRGLSEHIRIETSSGNPWFHRRICITSRSRQFLELSPLDTSGTERSEMATGVLETSNGFQRLAGNYILDTMPATLAYQAEALFKGQGGIDWDDYISAPVDTTRVDLKFDKTWVYKSGNERGVLRESKLWHPMNKNIVYDDDELGGGESSVNYSVQDKRGMGDYHIFDIFAQGSSGSTSDLLKVRYTSTLYWHEK